MTMHDRRTLLKLALAALLPIPSALAQSAWPVRPVRFVIPFPPGGGGDTVARAVTDKAAEALGQPIVVENKTGGNAVIAATTVVQAAPDGYTCLWDGNNHLSNRLLIKDLAFDYRTAFVPITLIARFPQVLAVRQDFPAQNFDAFLAYARANPGKVSCGTPPSGGMGHFALALLEKRADIKLIHTPYRGGSGRDARCDGRADRRGAADDVDHPSRVAGRQGAPARHHECAAQPALSRCARRCGAFSRYDMDDWNGLFAPTGTPDAVVMKINAAMVQALKDPAVVARMAPLGTVLVSSTPAEFGVWLARQREVIENIIRDAKITLSGVRAAAITA